MFIIWAGENLSGGEETKLKIAKAFSENNDVIFADEPTCNLDNEKSYIQIH